MVHEVDLLVARLEDIIRSLEDIIRSKEATGRPEDRLDVVVMRAMLKRKPSG